MAGQIDLLLKEMDQEAQTTRKMLSCIPEDKYDWRPHEKSMPIRRLAAHIAELPGWVTMALTTDGIDFADMNPEDRRTVHSGAELMPFFEETLADGKAHLQKADDAQLDEKWTFSSNGQLINESTRGETIRVAYSQIVHHRAQLGVYLRLLNVPIPGSYGPSADTPAF